MNECDHKDCGLNEYLDWAYEDMKSKLKPRDPKNGLIEHPWFCGTYLCEIKGHSEFCNCTPQAKR